MITNEEAKCIAEGMAEQMLDAMEKKLKGMGVDFTEARELAGMGKPIVVKCDAVEAARNFDPNQEEE